MKTFTIAAVMLALLTTAANAQARRPHDEEKKKVDALEDRLSIVKGQFESNIARTNVARDRYNSPLVYDITGPRDIETILSLTGMIPYGGGFPYSSSISGPR